MSELANPDDERSLQWLNDYNEQRERPMPRIHEMIESRFLKKEDAGDGVLVTINGVEQMNVAPADKPEELKWVCHFKELDKPMVLNSTNIQLFAAVCGSDDSDDWGGHKVVLYNDPTISFGGKITGGIRVRKPRAQAKPTPAAETARANAKPGSLADLEDDIPF